jgi:hypothetical protein
MPPSFVHFYFLSLGLDLALRLTPTIPLLTTDTRFAGADAT